MSVFVAFRSLIALAAAAIMWYSSPAKAEIPVKQITTNTASASKPLDLELRVKFNRCPDGFTEIPQLPAIVTDSPLGDPRRDYTLDIFAGEKSLDPEHDQDRLKTILLKDPVCALNTSSSLAAIPKDQARTENNYSSDSSGSRKEVRLESPYCISFKLLGKDNISVNNCSGGIRVDLNGSYINWHGNAWKVPELKLDDLTIGDSTFPAVRDNWSKFPAAIDKLQSDLENLVNGVTETLGSRELDIFFDWGGFFRDTLPKYINEEGLITDWDKLTQEVKKKAEDFYQTSLSSAEKSSIDNAITNFKNEFENLQNQNPLAKTAWRILNAEDPFCELKWKAVPLCEMYKMLESLGPELVEIQRNDGSLDIVIKDLNATLYGVSANSYTFRDDQGNSVTFSNYSRLQMRAGGKGFFHGRLSEGAAASHFTPERYSEDLRLIESILGRDLMLVDGEAHGQLEYNLLFSSERMHGFQAAVLRGRNKLSLTINNGTEYWLSSNGEASFNAIASSIDDLLLVEFQGRVRLEQMLRYRQDIAFGFFQDNENWWTSTNLAATLNSVGAYTEYWEAIWRYKQDYSGNQIQNDSKIVEIRHRDRWRELSTSIDSRLGLRFTDYLDLVILGSNKSAGLGFFVNTPQTTINGECQTDGICNVTARVPIIGSLSTNESRRHYLEKQQLSGSKLVGTEALEQDEDQRHNLELTGTNPGPFLIANAGFIKTFRNIFPYHNPHSGKLGLTLFDDIDNVSTYASLQYLGNFVTMHGASLELSTSEVFVRALYTYEIDRIRRTNSTTVGVETTLDLGGAKLVQRLELFPSAHDTDPRYEQQDDGTWSRKHEGDFQFLAQLRGEGDLLSGLIEAVKSGELNYAEISDNLIRFRISSDLRANQPAGREFVARLGYKLKNVSMNNELRYHLLPEDSRRFTFVGDAVYDAIHGFGPAVATKLDPDQNKDRINLLPGIGFTSSFGSHEIRAAGTVWDNEGLALDLRTRYIFNNPKGQNSLYLRAQAAGYVSFGLTKEERAKILEVSAALHAGLRHGPVLVLPYGEFDNQRKVSVGISLGIDFAYFVNNR